MHYANELLVRERKLAQNEETVTENVWKKSNDAYSLSIRVETTINHISICFLPQYQRQRNFRARAENALHCTTQWRDMDSYRQ